MLGDRIVDYQRYGAPRVQAILTRRVSPDKSLSVEWWFRRNKQNIVYAFMTLGAFAALTAYCIVCGSLYRRYHVFGIVTWFILPVVGITAGCGKFNAYLTERGLRLAQVWLCIFCISLSFCVGFDRALERHIAKASGGSVWYSDDGETDDNGNQVMSRHSSTPTVWSWMLIHSYGFAMISLAILFPLAVGKGFQIPISEMQRKREFEAYNAEMTASAKQS
jgi:hypothetical protein